MPNSCSILQAPFSVGVLVNIILRLWNVVVRFLIKFTGSPSTPADCGYRLTSSQQTIRMGRDARPVGELAPVIVMCPPGNDLWNSVLLDARLLLSAIKFLSAGVSLTIGARRSWLQVLARSTVGWSTIMGAGSWSIKYPTILFMISVLPTCADDIITIVSIVASATVSMISRWYSARLVRHRPGSALDSGESLRLWSAHSLTVSLGGAFQIFCDSFKAFNVFLR